MRHRLTVLVALVTLVAAPLGAVAQDGEQEDDESEYEQEVNVEDDKASIEVEQDTGEEEAEVEITFETTDAAFEVKAERENATQETEHKLEAKLHQLAEYEDENGNGQYDPNETIHSSWLLSEESEEQADGPVNGTVQWQALNVSDAESEDGVPGKHISGRALFQGDDPISTVTGALGQGENRTFGVDLFVFGETAEVGDQVIRPTEIKIDLLIENYPYTSEGTELALFLDTEAKSEVELEDGRGAASSQELGNLTAKLSFTWKDEAMVDGANEPVETTILESKDESETEEDEAETKTERAFALSYPRGEKIVHDPRTGAEIQSSDGGNGFDGEVSEAIPAPGLLGALAAMGAAVALIARKR